MEAMPFVCLCSKLCLYCKNLSHKLWESRTKTQIIVSVTMIIINARNVQGWQSARERWERGQRQDCTSFFFFFFLFNVFWNGISCAPGWPWTCHTVKDNFEFPILLLVPPKFWDEKVWVAPHASWSSCTDGFSALRAASLNLARHSLHYFSLSAEEWGSLSLSPLVLLASIFLSTYNWPLVKELQIGYIVIFIDCLLGDVHKEVFALVTGWLPKEYSLKVQREQVK